VSSALKAFTHQISKIFEAKKASMAGYIKHIADARQGRRAFFLARIARSGLKPCPVKIKTYNKIFVLLTGALLAGFCVFSQNSLGAGSTASNFLKITPGARPAGLGEAYTAVADGASSMYWNIAGLSRANSRELIVSHNVWFQDIQHSFVGFAIPIECDNKGVRSNSALGLSVTYLGTGSIERRTSNTANAAGNFDANDIAVAVGFGRSLENKIDLPLSIGASLKFINQRIDSYSANTLAADLGFLYALDTHQIPVSIGASIQNFGLPVKFIDESYPLPLTCKIGILASFEKRFALPLAVSVDLSMPTDNDFGWCLGTEYAATEMLTLRLGYSKIDQFTKDALTGGTIGAINNETLTNFTGFAAGFGFNIPLKGWNSQVKDMLSFDYAFVPYGDLGNTHRISLGLKW
jgi:hypothetical protein